MGGEEVKSRQGIKREVYNNSDRRKLRTRSMRKQVGKGTSETNAEKKHQVHKGVKDVKKPEKRKKNKEEKISKREWFERGGNHYKGSVSQKKKAATSP